MQSGAKFRASNANVGGSYSYPRALQSRVQKRIAYRAWDLFQRAGIVLISISAP